MGGRPMLLSDALIHDPEVTALNRLPTSGRVVGGSFSSALDGEWSFKICAAPELVSEADLTGATTGSDWSSIEVPGAWTLQGPVVRGDGNRSFDPPHYTNVVMPFAEDPPTVPPDNPTGVYRRRATVPEGWDRRRVILRVGAAESVVQVFVDGQFVGGGTDSRLANEFELGQLVTPGREFDLALVVSKWSAQTWLEDQDQWWHGGVQRSVVLHSVPESALAVVKIVPGLEPIDPGAAATATGTLAVEATITGPAVREPGWSLEVVVERDGQGSSGSVELVSSGRLPVPIWDDSSEAASLLSGMFVEPGVVRTDLAVIDIKPWSHEDPRLYSARLLLRNPEGETIDSECRRTGFRSVAVADNELLINGRAVLIHGVNIHEHSPTTGRHVTRDQTRRDLELMKAHNLNAVRAAHYPHAEHLAELCDELGLYMVDEANIESHARQASLCHDERFTTSIIERVRRMAERDQSHPSIIVWSLGNESGYGSAHDAAGAWLRRYDPSRPIQYEGPLMHDLLADAPVTDIVCPMYSGIDEIVGWATSRRDPRRPLIMCEYSHAMGNSNGSLSDYWKAFETVHGLQGGFIWEWVDHGLFLYGADGESLTGPGGRPSWGYGGDFGDAPNDANFVCDGLVSADRHPRPAMAEVHHVGRPVTVDWASADQASVVRGGLLISVTNRRWFSDTSDLDCRWSLSVDGTEVDAAVIDIVPLDPRSRSEVSIRLSDQTLARIEPGVEVHLQVSFALRVGTNWADRGHVVAVDQLVVESGPVGIAGTLPSSPVPEPGVIPWRPTVFRALTDNDGIRLGWMRGHVGNLQRWVDAQGLDRCEWRSETDGDGVCRGQLLAGSVDAAVEVTASVTSPASAWRRMQVDFDVPETLADLPRIGVEFHLSPDTPGGVWQRVEWFGDGPHDCYVDRRASARVARWRATIDDNYVDHALPQEHGHRTNLRWVSLERGHGSEREGLLFVGEVAPDGRRPGFSVRRHGDDQLWAATHAHDLVGSDAGSTYVHLDVAQRGLGTASCGPDALESYRIGTGAHRLVIWYRHFDPGSEDAGALYTDLRTEWAAVTA